MHPADEPFALREIWPPGTVIKGDYVIGNRLGAGGFGTVYLARSRFFGTTNVIKRLHEQFTSDPEFVRKFVNEGRAIRRLRGCPHIVEVEHMTQSEDGHLILVMEYVPGGDLAALIDSRPCSVDEVIDYARQIALGLQAAHQSGLVHRDIKPQNVLVARDPAGRPVLKLIDFGLAADHLSNQQTSVMRGGSIGYAAPEQWAKVGKELDGRSDLYSLGATMYRMLTGQMPYPGATEIGTWIDRIKSGPPLPVHQLRPDVPLELSRLIQDLLEVSVELRPPDAGVVIAHLNAINTSAVPAPPPPEWRPTKVEPPLRPYIPTQVEPIHQLSPAPVPQPIPAKPKRTRNGLAILAGANGLALILAAFSWRYLSTQVAAHQDPRGNPKDDLVYVWIPAGKFQMGCSDDDTVCVKKDAPLHDVEIAKGFWLGRTEVTQEAFKQVMGNNPSHFVGTDLPVENETYDQAANYCTAIGGTLPSAEQWEYAARAGTTGVRYGPLETIAWWAYNSGQTTHPVAKLQPNNFGLYDMLGNVAEWIDDPTPGSKQFRGGAFDDPYGFIHPTRDATLEPNARRNDMGFRCVWNP